MEILKSIAILFTVKAIVTLVVSAIIAVFTAVGCGILSIFFWWYIYKEKECHSLQ